MQKVINYLIGTFVFLALVFYIPGKNPQESQIVLFQVSAMLLFAVFLALKPVRRIRNPWIAGYLVYAIIIFLIRSEVRSVAVVHLVSIFLMTAVWYVFVNYLTDETPILRAIQAIIVVNLALVAMQLLKIDPITVNDMGLPNTRMVGIFGYPMNMGIFASLVIPYLLYKSKMWAIPASLLLFASLSYISITLGITAALVYLFIADRRLFKYVAIVVAIGGILLIAGLLLRNGDGMKEFFISKFVLRYEINYPLLRASLSNPHFGYGLGTFKYISVKAMGLNILDRIGIVDIPWNDYLGCTVEMGMGILVIFFGLFKQVWRDYRNSSRVNEITALFVSLATIPIGIMFHSYMHYINTGVICVALFALFTIKVKEEES